MRLGPDPLAPPMPEPEPPPIIVPEGPPVPPTASDSLAIAPDQILTNERFEPQPLLPEPPVLPEPSLRTIAPTHMAPPVVAPTPVAPPVVAPLPAPRETISAAVPPVGRPPRRTRRALPKVSPALLAGLTGVVLFAALSGFGREVRVAKPITAHIDHLLQSFGFTINEVSITGHKLALDSDIYAALQIDRDSSILGYDVIAARKRIEDISWIAEAEVARVLPDKLRVHVTERKPVALWRNGDQQALIDATGRILARVSRNADATLPVVAGSGAPEATSELLGALALHPTLAKRVAIATRIGNRRWSLALADGSVIHLPEAASRDALRRLSDLDRRAGLLNRPAQVIDLRRQGVVAIGAQTRRAQSTPTPPAAQPAAARPSVE